MVGLGNGKLRDDYGVPLVERTLEARFRRLQLFLLKTQLEGEPRPSRQDR